MPKIKLKPCPFCGSNEVYVFSGNNYIVCTTCKAKFQKAHFQTDKYLTGEQLSEAWNMRTELIRCGECKHMMPDGRCDEFADETIRPSASDFCSYAEWARMRADE